MRSDWQPKPGLVYRFNITNGGDSYCHAAGILLLILQSGAYQCARSGRNISIIHYILMYVITLYDGKR